LFVAGGSYGIYQYRRLSRTGVRVSGTVVDLRWKISSSGESRVRVAHPVLSFRTLDGREIRAETGVGSSRVIAWPGEQVPVIYDPRNPAKAEINTRAGRPWWLLVLCVAAGAALIGYGVVKATSG
jgi:hypothetical protein